MPHEKPNLLTVDEAAAVLRLHPSTVRRMLERGELDAFQTGARGAWRIRVDVAGLPRFRSRDEHMRAG